ncbi:hypothetical protein PWT90_09379 [Aphanocladium album]|nr:hypothetical protein PWT90_09379 [Aphanocladium album]
MARLLSLDGRHLWRSHRRIGAGRGPNEDVDAFLANLFTSSSQLAGEFLALALRPGLSTPTFFASQLIKVFCPGIIILKKQKPNSDEEYDNELDMYKRLTTLQGKQIPVCYGEARCDGIRALVLGEVDGVSLLHSSALMGTTEEQMKKMIFGPMTDHAIAYDDWKLDNFHLVDGEIVFLDLEHAYDLDEDERQYTIKTGLEAFLDRWRRARKQYEKYGEIERWNALIRIE